MEIIVARASGFCFGVKRAINLAEKRSALGDGEIYTLGPIIHNPQVVKRMEEMGVRVKSSVGEIEGGTVIIRSHGVTYEDLKAASSKGLEVLDATCPFVKKAQALVSSLSGEGYFVVIVGEKEHPEVKGLVSYGGGDIMVAGSAGDLDGMARKKKIGIVAQTTVPHTKLVEVTGRCLALAQEIKVYNTICDATSVRQRESIEIAREVDCMFVVGGRNSANTRRLAEVCRSIRPSTHHIEVASEIEPRWIEGAGKVGVTAGASTPQWIIREVVDRIASIGAGGR
ncbi:MAG TPA: 4-hydroxy-3-methylbut-2-enyl diphosphate reductase [Deltaproteobacteria bacterium]|nr:4-hydroxy-3-methylbut-2-enyl diphosphate reductase [Deltaproteobacteria bacterium]